MTMKERDILGEIKDDISTLSIEIKKLTSFMDTYKERSKHCAKTFVDIDNKINEVTRVSDWNRNKIIAFMAILGAIVWIVERFLR